MGDHGWATVLVWVTPVLLSALCPSQQMMGGSCKDLSFSAPSKTCTIMTNFGNLPRGTCGCWRCRSDGTSRDASTDCLTSETWNASECSAIICGQTAPYLHIRSDNRACLGIRLAVDFTIALIGMTASLSGMDAGNAKLRGTAL